MFFPIFAGVLASLLWQPISLSTAQGGSAAAENVQKIEFREFFESSIQELKPSAKLLSLNGARVRLVGFMANLEAAPEGSFYLCPHPVYGDESGGGTADLPVESVRVIVRSAKGKKISFINRAIEVTGILEVGNRAEEDGTVSAIRLILDNPQSFYTPSKINGSQINKIRKH